MWMDLPTIFLVQQEIKRGLNNLDSENFGQLFGQTLYFEMSRETIGYRYVVRFLHERIIHFSSFPSRFSHRRISSHRSCDISWREYEKSLSSLSLFLVSIWRNCLKNFIADDSSVVTFRRRVGIFLNCYEKFLARRFLNPNSSIIHEDSKIAESREYRHLRLAFAPLITQLLYN